MKDGGRIIETWKSFCLVEAELNGVSWEVNILEDLSRCERLFIMGPLVSKKLDNKDAFRSTMQNLWRLQCKVNFKEVGFNLFVIEFLEEKYLQNVQEGRP